MKKISGMHALLTELIQHLQKHDPRSLQLLGTTESLLQVLICGLGQNLDLKNTIVLILPHQKDIFLWRDVLKSIQQNLSEPCEICLLPYYLVWGPEKYVNHVHTRQEKLRTLDNLLNSPHKKIVLTTLPGLAQKTMTRSHFLDASLQLHLNDTLDLDVFMLKLRELGYQECVRVDDKATFSVRGGIIDVFPLQEQRPLRIELLGDEIQSLRYFSAETQRSEEPVSMLRLVPTIEAVIVDRSRKHVAQGLYDFLLAENVSKFEVQALMASLDSCERTPNLEALTLELLNESQCPLEYLPKDSLFVFPHTVELCFQSFQDFFQSIQNLYDKDREAKHAVSLPTKVFLNETELRHQVQAFLHLECENPVENAEALRLQWVSSSSLKSPRKDLEKQKRKEQWLAIFSRTLDEGGSIILFGENGSRSNPFLGQALGEAFEEIRQDALILQKLYMGKMHTEGMVLSGGLINGAIYDEEQNVWLVSEQEFLGRKRSALAANRKLKNLIASFKDLSIEDLVVHLDHGIGRYKGMTQIAVQGFKGDFLILEYRGADRVYLPVDRLNLLQKYKKAEGNKTPTLDKLGGDAFKIRKAKVERAIKETADDLLRVQAERKLLRGHAFAKAGDIYERFVEDFPYQETPDQLRCMEEVEEDFKGSHPMDRLVVGDVGFGKTEVALRAALRAILEGFQVMFLVPTTVLCYQHFYNFRFRLEKLGVRLGQAHRLIKRSEQKIIFDDFENGKIDLLLGTHRILSKDLRPKNLGLLIVDEEQRFGVLQKEKFKKLKANLDILTLSATPIPRTLHMALLGLRDISLITTPPANRMPVRTIISEFDENLVRTAIESEIARGGQVFYVHNRVGDLAERGEELKRLIPSAKIRTAHGQMHEESLDAIIIDFIEQKFNVLVCTTIIESGVDMPNVNTLIVENAQAFGLAQLYQLRGRVGRSSIQAYAYLLIKKEEFLSPEAKKRLEVLATHQELGSGFQIANYDLELRGTGNLIGREQSGQIASIGFEMYVEMLEEKIKELSSVKVERKFDPEIKIKVTAFIPSSFVTDERERLAFYKQLFSATSREEIFEINKISEDRYGSLPIEYVTLVKIALLRLRLRLLGAASIIELERNLYEVRFVDSKKEKRFVRLHNLKSSDTEDFRLAKILKQLETF